MARRTKPIEYSTENEAYKQGALMWPWFIGFILLIVLLKVIS